jgi:hypothetical protein
MAIPSAMLMMNQSKVQEARHMSSFTRQTEVSCAVEVFLATALLHKENPGRPEFTIQEITERAERENINGEVRPGVSVHASQHCVANRPPNPAKHRMLLATGKRTRRLLLRGDEVHPERNGKIFPDPGEVPERYLPLLEWAKARYDKGGPRPVVETHASAGQAPEASVLDAKAPERWLESLFELEGLGKEYWQGFDPDDFVRKMREGWE